MHAFVLQLEVGRVLLRFHFLVQLRHLGKHLKKVFILWAHNKYHKVICQSVGFSGDFCTEGMQTVVTKEFNWEHTMTIFRTLETEVDLHR